MKKGIIYSAIGLAVYSLGIVTGYFVRKKTCEVAFEEISEEEQAAMAANDAKGPVDICQEVDKVFDSPEENTKENGLTALNTQKINYMNRLKAEEAMSKYDTRTKDDPDNVVTADDLEEGIDQELLNQMTKEIDGPHPDIEEAGMEDWEHWSSQQGTDFDPEYDCVEIMWFKDGVLTDGEGKPLENPGKFIGFDVEEKFNEISADTTGDPDVRIIYNHPKGAIYQIIRKHCDYNRKRGMEEFGGDYGGEDEDDE